MADEEESSKTEQPTQRKLDEALKKGQVPNSREVNNFLMLCTFALVIAWLSPTMMIKFTENFTHYIEAPHLIELSKENSSNILKEAIMGFAETIFPVVVIAVFVAFFAGLSQHKLVFSAKSLVPSLEKISPLRGLKKLFSMQSVIEFLKGIIKITCVGAITYMILWPLRNKLDFLITFDMMAIMVYMQSISNQIMIGILSFMLAVAALDFFYQQFDHMKKLRMSKQEIKEEARQSDGDPHVKAKLKQIRMERVRKRMMAAVPKADVVITNPTHFSIALKYEHEKMRAPVVVAKGLDNIALKIREIAKENNVAIVENPPLARALYDAVELDEEIPIEFYQTVAEVISYVYRLKQNKAA